MVEIAGSFAYFGVSANLITYLTGPLGQSNAAAAAAVNAWTGTGTLMPLLGAFVADSWLGRYRSIILACTLYVLGYGMITLASTLPALRPPPAGDPSPTQVAFFYGSLYLIAVAQGADKPCGVAFAADQFDPGHPGERAARGSLFNWWYFSMAAGITVAVAVMSYVQENVGWGVGFGAPCFVMLAAFAAFLAGSPTYRLLHTPDDAAKTSSSPFARLARSLLAAIKTKKKHQQQLEVEDESSEAARSVLRLMPIWAACLAYGVVNAQIMTLFNKQGRTLDRRVRIFDDLELPPAALQALGPATILLFVPIYDRLLVPALRPGALTPLRRVGTGMALSALTVCVAALVEARRLDTARQHGLVTVHAGGSTATVPMSWAWLVPQYVTIGVADVFAVVGMQEFFYDQMPGELRSLGLAMYLSVMGIGGFISSAMISVIDRVTSSGGGDSWFADDLNRGHLDYFYWLLAGLSAAELVMYLCLARSYVYSNRRLLR